MSSAASAPNQHPAGGARKALQDQLRQAEAERERIKEAIRIGSSGAALPTLVEMLAEAEERVQRLREQLRAGPGSAEAVVQAIPRLVEDALRNLRSVLGQDTDRARALLGELVGEIILRPEGDGLVAELREGLPPSLVDATGSGGRI